MMSTHGKMMKKDNKEAIMPKVSFVVEKKMELPRARKRNTSVQPSSKIEDHRI